MKISYKYKNEIFEDIRDITKNNKLQPNWEVIFNEYLPFQIFIDGKTIFKDLTVHSHVSYAETKQECSYVPFLSLLESSTEKYLKRHNFSRDNAIAAVSGGTDSSLIALLTKPDKIYSGYYTENGFSELEYSSLIANEVQAKHCKVELTESDFMFYLQNMVDNIGVPIGGLGSVMEYAALNRICETNNIDTVLFGNGGDEVFLSYFFCHIVKDLIQKNEKSTIGRYMRNFTGLEQSAKFDLVDFAIASILNRSEYNIRGTDPFPHLLSGIAKTDYIEKLLRVTIDCILPSLLHLNGQMCKAHDVSGLNPLTSIDLISKAKALNTPMSSIPKGILKFAHPNMPYKISTRTDKQGFPIPIHKWKTTLHIIDDYANRFLCREESILHLSRHIEKFDSLSLRYKWGMCQAELFLRKHNR